MKDKMSIGEMDFLQQTAAGDKWEPVREFDRLA